MRREKFASLIVGVGIWYDGAFAIQTINILQVDIQNHQRFESLWHQHKILYFPLSTVKHMH